MVKRLLNMDLAKITIISKRSKIIYIAIMKAFRSARMKYEGYLKSENKKEYVSEKVSKVLQISSDIENLYSKCSTLERTIKMLGVDFI